MKLYLDNVGIIKDSEFLIDGLTVVAGVNSSGKTTIGKILYSVYNALENIENRNLNDKINYAILQMNQIVQSGEVQYICNVLRSKTVDANNDFFSAFEHPVSHFRSLEEVKQYLIFLKKSIVDLELLINQTVADDSNSGNKLLITNILEKVRNIFLPKIDGVLSVMEIDSELVQYTNDWIAKSIGNEMCNQVQPIRLNNIISTISIEDNSPNFLNISINEKTNYNVNCNRIFKSVSQVYLLDNVLDLDQSKSSIFERFNVTLNRSNENLPVEYYELMNSRNAQRHNNKNRFILSKANEMSVIEENELGQKMRHIMRLIDDVIPGHFVSRNDGMFYVENDNELNAQNLASGAKLMAMIKILLSRGAIDERTLLILDEPECHLHPEWQRKLAIIICLIIRDLGAKVVVTTHNPNFMLAIDTYSIKFGIREKTNFYQSEKTEDNYMTKFRSVNDDINLIYSSLSKPFLELDVERSKLVDEDDLMNTELANIDTYLITLGVTHKTYCDLSKNSAGSPLVTDSTCEAYDFDEITNIIYKISPHSVDALLLKDDLYFIEFKRVTNVRNLYKQKIIKQNLQLKLSESVVTFYKKMVEPLRIDTTKFKKIAIIVVDSSSSPISAMAGVLANLSGRYLSLTTNNFSYHNSPDRSGIRTYFDDVQVWNDTNFTIKVSSL